MLFNKAGKTGQGRTSVLASTHIISGHMPPCSITTAKGNNPSRRSEEVKHPPEGFGDPRSQHYLPSSLLSSTRIISFSRWAGVWLTALCTDRRITDSASFTKMKIMEIWGRSLPYFSSLHLQHKGEKEKDRVSRAHTAALRARHMFNTWRGWGPTLHCFAQCVC